LKQVSLKEFTEYRDFVKFLDKERLKLVAVASRRQKTRKM